MNEYLDKFKNLVEIDHEFLISIAKTADISTAELYEILLFSQSDYVEYPLDDSEYDDINEGYEDKYDWNEEGPVRISGYGRAVDYAMTEISDFIIDNEVRNNRLMTLTIDFGNYKVKNPLNLFFAVNLALQNFGDKLLLETVCLCQLQREGKDVFPILSIKLPYLKNLILNRVKCEGIDFFAAPRLESINVINSGIDTYDFSRMRALKELCIGCYEMRKVVLPEKNGVKKIIIGRGETPTPRAKNYGLGIDILDMVTNINFSLEYLSAIECGVSKVDLSVCSNLKHLDLSSNPINQLNLAWVPGLEYLNLKNTGIKNLEANELKKIKYVFSDNGELETGS